MWERMAFRDKRSAHSAILAHCSDLEELLWIYCALGSFAGRFVVRVFGTFGSL
jgi:hypothetical protein